MGSDRRQSFVPMATTSSIVFNMTLRRALSISLLAVAALTLPGCGAASSTSGNGPSPGSERPQVIVTYPVLGAVVRAVVGDTGDVKVLMPNGSDPHEWSPSAKDIQAILNADLVVENGLGLEGGLHDPIKEAKARGVDVFTVADHISVRKVKAGEGAEADDPDQAPGADDPHLWMDPLTMKQWVQAFVPALATAGIDGSANASKVQADLDALNTEVTGILDGVPAERRRLVTGHESLGYLAERYRYQLVGAVVPSLTSQGESSAGELADLTKKIRAAGVPAIFTEIGTPKATAEAIGKDSGAKVVGLSTHTLPADGSYRTFMLDIANTIAGALR
jgi:zinc/manganese transport system substrate-binding protein